MKVETFVEDVQSLIEETEQDVKADTKLGFTAYATLDQIYDYLNEVAAASNGTARVINIGKSFENRDLLVLEIATGPSPKPAIWLDGNIHAREWITSAVATYLINELVNGTDANIQSWARDFDFYIMPVMNPDGLAYTKATDRLWRKTRSTTGSVLGCRGADANRNYGYKWLTGGSSTNPCSDTFAGGEEFSEVESQAVRDFITSISGNLVSYISLHSYSQLILLPFGHENTQIPQYSAYMTLGNNIARAMAARYGTVWTPGNIVDLLYVASGGSMDWVKGTYNTNLTLTYEMRDTGRYGFLLPADQIVPSSLEFLDGFELIIQALRNGITTPPLPTEFADVKETKTPAAPRRTRIAPSILDRPAGRHDTFGHVPHPRRGISPLESFQRF
jgi:hypothetical protein